MKRSLAECHQEWWLPLDLVLKINSFIVEVGIIEMKDLLAWHSCNKPLSKLWSDRSYITTVFRKVEEKSKLLFPETRHGFYLVNSLNFFYRYQMLPLVDVLFEKIINHISIQDTVEMEEPLIFKSVLIGKNNRLTVDDLIPIALRKHKKRLWEILSAYMSSVHGWTLESHKVVEQLGFLTRTSEWVCVRPLYKSQR